MRTIAALIFFFSAVIYAQELSKGPATLPSGTLEESVITPLPGGQVPFVKKTFRPFNYETPLAGFSKDITPNDAFFVRYHLTGVPKIQALKWKLELRGDSFEHAMTFDLADLKKMKQVEITALGFCSGNRRGLFEPHAPGVQWGYGAMGNARWKGPRLRDVIEKAGLKKDAVELVFSSADTPAYNKTPSFQKSLPLSKALDDNTIVALEMNGRPIPEKHGFPARLIVPGWTATYWVKHLVSIEAVSKPYGGYWMKSAYRIPTNKFPGVKFASQENDKTTPITELMVNSLVTNLEDGQHIKLGPGLDVKGLAWDGGHGIEKVEYSTDGGFTWKPARLGKDMGNYSWRRFSFDLGKESSGPHVIIVDATNKLGMSQSDHLTPNGGGYHHNLLQKIKIFVDGTGGSLQTVAVSRGAGDAGANVTAAAGAWLTENQIELKAGPGHDKVVMSCTMCHSLDYIPMNSPFLDQAGWSTEVHKMIEKMGAPIKPDDVAPIVDYLARNYGKP